MNYSFNTNFGGVRVHTDSQADQLNQSLQARAFTTGQHIFFRYGEYSPHSSNGKMLLSHELAHVMQQNSGFPPQSAPQNSTELGTQIQRATTIKYKKQDLEYQDDTNTAYSAEVGDEMTVVLDPADPRIGSEPGGGVDYDIYDSLNYWYNKNPLFIKGHLLNAHLGGLGVPENLFPITAQANSIHKDYEATVKGALIGQIEEKNNARPYAHIRYRVRAKDKSKTKYFDDDPQGNLILNAEYINPISKATLQDIFTNIVVASRTGGKKGDAFNAKLTAEGWGGARERSA
ncbi:MAG: DUF4157 domain-containing protein [Anaerolineae bacterium]|nr:DUF4157 domain-containing protein [Anaerolineae bacterium]